MPNKNRLFRWLSAAFLSCAVLAHAQETEQVQVDQQIEAAEQPALIEPVAEPLERENTAEEPAIESAAEPTAVPVTEPTATEDVKTGKKGSWLFGLWGEDEDSPLEEQGLPIYIATAYIDMHTGPGRGFPIFHVIENNEKVWVVKRRTNWLQVETRKGKRGWVDRATLKARYTPNGPLIVFQQPKKTAYEERKWEIGVLTGEFEGADGLTNYVSYHLTPNLAAELKYTQAFGSFSNSKLVSINALHQMYPRWRVSPFFTVGAGTIKIEPNADLAQSQDREDNVMSVGAGVFINVSRRFLFRIEYDEHKILTTRENNDEVSEWKAGFSVYF